MIHWAVWRMHLCWDQSLWLWPRCRGERLRNEGWRETKEASLWHSLLLGQYLRMRGHWIIRLWFLFVHSNQCASLSVSYHWTESPHTACWRRGHTVQVLRPGQRKTVLVLRGMIWSHRPSGAEFLRCQQSRHLGHTQPLGSAAEGCCSFLIVPQGFWTVDPQTWAKINTSLKVKRKRCWLVYVPRQTHAIISLWPHCLTQNTAMDVCTISRVKPVGAQVGRDHLLNQRLKLQVFLVHATWLMDPLNADQDRHQSVNLSLPPNQ